MRSAFRSWGLAAAIPMALAAALAGGAPAAAQDKKPNIILIVSDDTGYGDLGPYGGGEGRGMPTPNIDRLADEGMTFFSFYAQPSCTPGRAAMQTGRIPNRSGMTTVAFQGQGGGLPAAEWTLASVLKTGGYKTYFTGKWHLGEADYALPNAQGYDEMKYCGLYHLNAYTYADPTWFPDMDPELRAMFEKVTKGSLSGKAGEPAKEDFKINGQYVDTPDKGVVGIPVLRRLRREGGARISRRGGEGAGQAVLHQRQLHEGAPAEPAGTRSSSTSRCRRASTPTRSSSSTPASAASWTSCATLGLDKNTLVFYTTDNGAWQDVYPDAGYTPFRGTKGTVREGGNRVPAIAWMAGQDQGRHEEPRHRRRPRPDGDLRRGRRRRSCRRRIARASRSSSTATTCRRSCSAPASRARKTWFYFTENELTPGRGARRQLQGGVQPARRQRRRRPAASPSTPTSAGRARRSTSRPCRRSSTSGRTRRSATTSS